MQVHRDLNQLPSFRNAVVSIGTFDGVHLGHQKIIHRVKEEAKQINGESIIVTFHPHPRKVLGKNCENLQLLNTLEEKMMLLDKQGIDHLIIVPFTKEFSQQSAEEYIEYFLVEKLQSRILIIGYDHHFGHNREGNIELLRCMEDQYHFSVLEIPEQDIHNLSISSTKIRTYLRAGKIKQANELLGYPYFISGKVVHGDQRGRTLGYPTANINPENAHKLIPTEGVYATEALIPFSHTEYQKGQTYQGALNIGYRPTFDGKEQRIELFIFDFDEDIYDSHILVRFRDFIRPDKKFSDVSSLKNRMREDVVEVKKRLRELEG